MLEWFAEQPAEVKVAIVGMIGAIIVAAIQYWKGKPAPKEHNAEIAGAVIDNRAIEHLAESVEDLTAEVKSSKGAASRMTDQLDRRLEALCHEIARLREELIKSAAG